MSGIRTPSGPRAIPYLDVAMQMPRSRPAPNDGLSGRRDEQLAIVMVLLLHIVIRLLAWHAAALVEDHGSISQLFHAKVFATFDPRQILQLEPDTTPFYPFLVALFGLPGWSLETAARVCSLAFSLLLFVAVLRIGLRIAGPWATVAGLVLLSLNPVLARLAPAILTEPSYVATVYLGLWLFWRQYERPRWRGAAVVGVVFGLAFLNRVEALLFLPAIPLFQAVHYWASRPRRYGGRQLAGWVAAFVAGFVLLAGPQVGWVSWRMDRPAFNGRQVWEEIEVKIHEDESYERMVYGLDYHPSVVNITYLQAHPTVMTSDRATPKDPTLVRYSRLVTANVKDLVFDKLDILIGFFGFLAFLVGMVVMIRRGQRADALLIVGFLAVALAGPLLHNVVVRHILVLAPLMLLVGGIGIAALAERLAARPSAPQAVAGLGALLLLLMAIAWAPELRRMLRRETCNREYCVSTMDRAGRIVRESARGLGREPRVAARKQYLPYYSGGVVVALPYTDYDGLVRYLRANSVDYLFLEDWQITSYPFVKTFAERASADFTFLDRQTDPTGRTTALYRVNPLPAAVAGLPKQ
jgi:4-amino-4-deoxy-L-arabinose transferase-like glycosyltransferase